MPVAAFRTDSTISCARPAAAHDDARAKTLPYAAFRFRSFVSFALGNFVSITGRQMLTIAIEWEVYARTHSATALGLVGLVAAVPIVALSLPAGHLADRFSRKANRAKRARGLRQ